MKIELTQRELGLVRQAIAFQIPDLGTSPVRSELRGILQKLESYRPTSRPKLDRRPRVPAAVVSKNPTKEVL